MYLMNIFKQFIESQQGSNKGAPLFVTACYKRFDKSCIIPTFLRWRLKWAWLNNGKNLHGRRFEGFVFSYKKKRDLLIQILQFLNMPAVTVTDADKVQPRGA